MSWVGNGPSMSQTGVSASNLGFTSVRGRLTSKVPDVPEAEVFVEAEQGLNEAQRRALSVGGNYRMRSPPHHRLPGAWRPAAKAR